MNTIKPGVVHEPSPKLMRAICDRCGGEFEAFDNEKIFLPYARSNPKFKMFCPTPKCGTYITFCPYLF